MKMRRMHRSLIFFSDLSFIYDSVEERKQQFEILQQIRQPEIREKKMDALNEKLELTEEDMQSRQELQYAVMASVDPMSTAIRRITQVDPKGDPAMHSINTSSAIQKTQAVLQFWICPGLVHRIIHSN